MDDENLLTQLQHWARELDFQQIGVSDIDVGQHAQYLQRWLQNGYHADMHWMQQHAALREHPEQLHTGALRVISVRMDYLSDQDSNLIAKVNADGGAYIARYALGRDYHKWMRKRLALLAQKIETQFPHKHRAVVDSAPVLERAFAQKSGLGWEIQRLAFNCCGATKACVGQRSKHAVQVPQCVVSCGAVKGSGKSVRISPRKKYEPACELISMVFLPIQPKPDFCANARSSTGALSTTARCVCATCVSIFCASRARRLRIHLW